VDGGVNWEMNRVKVLVRLIDTMNGEQLWAENYQKELTAVSLGAIQESIVRNISAVLGNEYGIISQKLSADLKRIKPQQLDTYLAVLKFYHFESHQTPKTAADAFWSLEKALEKDPESGIATALLASLHGNRYMLDLPGAKGSYQTAGELAEKAVKLDPYSLIVRVIYVFKCLVYNEKERLVKEVDQCLSMNPNLSSRIGSLGFHLCMIGLWDRGKHLLDKVMQTNIGYPLYFHGATSLFYYRTKQYEKALKESEKYNIPALFWGPMLKTAVLGQLGSKEEAAESIAHLLSLKPDFKTKAHYLISRFVKEEKLVLHILNGINKAGMEIQ
jgi:adenylate cyclase